MNDLGQYSKWSESDQSLPAKEEETGEQRPALESAKQAG